MYPQASEVSEVLRATASAVLILLLFTVISFHVTAADDCRGYTSYYNRPVSCSSFNRFCCGTCENRFCCSDPRQLLTQDDCQIYSMNTDNSISTGVIGLVIVVILCVFAVIICCCCCPCCCLYNMCRKPTPVVGTSTTTVVNTQCIVAQPVIQGGQYPAYHPVPTQPAYGVQPMPAGPYQAQPYAPGPPPSYQTVVGPGYPSSQAMSPVHAPAQAGFAPTDALKQPAYNPAYM